MGKYHSSEHMMKTLPRRMTLCPSLAAKNKEVKENILGRRENGHHTVRISTKVNSGMFLAGSVGVSANHISIESVYG